MQKRDGNRKINRRANHYQKGYGELSARRLRLKQSRLRPKAHQTHHLTSGNTLQAAHTSLVRLSALVFIIVVVATHAVIRRYNVPQMLAGYKTMRQRQFQFSTRCACNRRKHNAIRGSSARSPNLAHPLPRLHSTRHV